MHCTKKPARTPSSMLTSKQPWMPVRRPTNKRRRLPKRTVKKKQRRPKKQKRLLTSVWKRPAPLPVQLFGTSPRLVQIAKVDHGGVAPGGMAPSPAMSQNIAPTRHPKNVASSAKRRRTVVAGIEAPGRWNVGDSAFGATKQPSNERTNTTCRGTRIHRDSKKHRDY